MTDCRFSFTSGHISDTLWFHSLQPQELWHIICLSVPLVCITLLYFGSSSNLTTLVIQSIPKTTVTSEISVPNKSFFCWLTKRHLHCIGLGSPQTNFVTSLENIYYIFLNPAVTGTEWPSLFSTLQSHALMCMMVFYFPLLLHLYWYF